MKTKALRVKHISPGCWPNNFFLNIKLSVGQYFPTHTASRDVCVYCELWLQDVWCHVQVQAPLKAPSAALITPAAALCERLLTA